jgi:nicotinate phosphoribosyltransferase
MIPSSHLSKIYRAGWGNLTDFYQLTMAYGYWKQELHERKAVFHLFFRGNPFKGQFTVAAGLALVVDFLKNWKFSAEEVQYLGSVKGADGRALFSETFLHYLQRLRFTGSVYAVPEGTIMFPHEPLIRIEASLLEAQLIETALLTMVNFSSLIATKAARIRQAAGNDEILEFGLRRAQGIDGALTASRSAYLGGCDATSNVWAGQYLGIPVKGTHAHSWVMVFADELEAFRAYADALPNNCIFLVDTYDTLKGVEKAIEVGLELRKSGHRLLGVRLDSGDLTKLSKRARTLLDEAGFPGVAIVASNELDEYAVGNLKDEGAPITTWGIGTRLSTAYDQPALGGVYKLAAIENAEGVMEPRIKLSEQEIKISNPGAQQVRRYYQNEIPVGDIIYEVGRPPGLLPELVPLHLAGTIKVAADAESKDLLLPVMEAGEVCYEFPSLTEIRTYCLQQVKSMKTREDKPYIYGLELQLDALKTRMKNEKK